LIILSAIWGSAFIAIKFSLEFFSPTTVASLRLIIAAFFLLIFFYLGKYKANLNLYDIYLLIFIGIVGNFLPFLLISWAEQFIQSSTAGLLMAIGPILTLVLSHFLTKDDKFTIKKFISILIGFIGVLFILDFNTLFKISSANQFELIAKLLVIVAAFGYMISNILAYKSLKSLSSITITTFATLFGAIFSLPFMIFSEFIDPSVFKIRSLLPIVYLGLFPTAIAFQFRYYITKISGPVFLSYVAYLIPIFALLWGYLLLSENIYFSSLIGITLILIGVYVSQHNLMHKKP